MMRPRALQRFFVPFIAVSFSLFLFLGIAHFVHHLGKEDQAAKECPVYQACLKHQSLTPTSPELPTYHRVLLYSLLSHFDPFLLQDVWKSPPGRSPPSSLV